MENDLFEVVVNPHSDRRGVVGDRSSRAGLTVDEFDRKGFRMLNEGNTVFSGETFIDEAREGAVVDECKGGDWGSAGGYHQGDRVVERRGRTQREHRTWVDFGVFRESRC